MVVFGAVMADALMLEAVLEVDYWGPGSGLCERGYSSM